MPAKPASVFRSALNVAWSFARSVNAILPNGQSPQPSWAPGPLLKSWERMQMTAGVPRKHSRYAQTAIEKQQTRLPTVRPLSPTSGISPELSKRKYWRKPDAF